MEYPSILVENAVQEIAKLPGIGKKTALRLALHLLKEQKEKTFLLTKSLTALREKSLYCQHCHTISDDNECVICKNNKRNRSLLCVVEDTCDVLAIENTSQYTGLYHVLGGVISPINGVGPSKLTVEALVHRVADSNAGIREIILALSPTLEGDTTSFYLGKRLKKFSIKLSAIARGIPVGGRLEYADEITLGRSIATRTEVV